MRWKKYALNGRGVSPDDRNPVPWPASSDGSVAYSQPQAATAKDAPFYPQLYQPGELSLNLAKDQTKGEYTIVLKVKDNLGNQSYETREKFTVE